MTAICKKCLLKELSQDEYFKNIYEYISQLDETVKVDDLTYSNRLYICKQCDNMVNGMCRICGCFVEVRAAKKLSYCPCIDKKWNSI